MVFRCSYCTIWISMLYLNSMWHIFFYIHFCTSNYTLNVKLSETISFKYILKQNITSISSIAHGFFNNLTTDKVNDLSHPHRKNPKLTVPTSKSQDNFSDTSSLFTDNQTPSINNTKGITSPPPFYTKRPNIFV